MATHCEKVCKKLLDKYLYKTSVPQKSSNSKINLTNY